ncbi:acyltransferase domain-containing protein, partial [Streptomyces sp. NPDC006602]|uniref:acyltransferase domain-containing protein n=1 Tax=Streptomyces sp. NPDC006602 TaxID=3364751 RepID=UPI003677062E
KTVFVFPGQGSQWDGMARDLLTTSPVFAHHLTQAADTIAQFTDWNLIDVLTGQPHTPPLDRVDVVQPALFAINTALARLWQHHNVHPDTVIGHSQGEIAAAHIAGALTLHDAAKIITLRSQAIHTHLAGTGGMASIPLPPDHTQTLLTDYDDLHIAAHNSPTNTVIAGNPHQLQTLVDQLNTRNIRARTIPVDYASHTPHVHTLKTTLTDLLHDITPQPTNTAFYSTLRGEHIHDTTELDATYWYDNLANPVQLHPTLNLLHHDHHTTYIEISPHPVLTHALTDTLPHHTLITETLRRDHGTLNRFHHSLAHLHTHGHPTTWHHPHPTTKPHHLPTYPFQHHRYWL